MCYVKTKSVEIAQPNIYNGMCNGSFNPSLSHSFKRSSTPIIPKATPVFETRQETDREYAERCIQGGLYTSALCDLRGNRSLHSLFFSKLQSMDNKLYRVRFYIPCESRYLGKTPICLRVISSDHLTCHIQKSIELLGVD